MNDLDDKTVARFWAKVNKEGPVHPTLGTKCWLWAGAISGGYGLAWSGLRMIGAHRLSYEECRGKIPPGLHLDHLCRVPSCVNPEHLEPVTQQENTRRGIAGWNMAVKTHCPQGHEYAGDNLIVYRGQRHCRECGRARARIYIAKKRAAEKARLCG